MQGLTELTECVRTDDEWLFQVQNEIRAGALSDESHRFLHGRPTRVPGSWVNGRCDCGEARCEELAKVAAKAPSTEAAAKALQDECATCQAERAERCRVLQGPGDARHLQQKFLDAPAIVPNNDIKYDVNKSRSTEYAERTRQAITWVSARDRPLPATLKEKPTVSSEKLKWLQRHDKDCGALYGMLPLVRGMPVSLQDHLDRNPKKQLLRGRVGYLKTGCSMPKRPAASRTGSAS